MLFCTARGHGPSQEGESHCQTHVWEPEFMKTSFLEKLQLYNCIEQTASLKAHHTERR